jgi:XTP/dITP diphosphohydrolase
MSKPTLFVATTNAHKLREIGQILKVKTESTKLEVLENGRTFEANAIKKATEVLKHALKAGKSVSAVLADDSGLMVDCLNGRPGIRSARFAIPPTPENLCNKLLEVMAGCKKRSAKFVCAMALARPIFKKSGTLARITVRTVKGIVRGHIVNGMCGKNGFGYDAVFMPVGHKLTFGQMSAAKKNRLSHRYRALMKMKKIL